jgi:3-hydroxy-9,10-secoandrosta-1,3,5(10)-triene-9,17-dione monooxygenase reductase component
VIGSVVESSLEFRRALGCFATGVVVVAGIDAPRSRPTGLTISSFTSVSLEPPLVSFCVAHTSTTWQVLRSATRLCVNVLGEQQRPVCARFATTGGDKFGDVGWIASPGGAPVLDGAIAWFDCTVQAEHVAGDHVIVVARVHYLARREDGSPLIIFGGTYGRFRAGDDAQQG